ncbi:MAG TPA: hypothetical protein VK013_15475 [Myxococcaceae bacterium]|nr:hypothetical protein [Myxococcaceae bacterium]
MSPARATQRFLLSTLVATSVLVTGCQHAGHQSSARTLDAHQSRFSVAVGAGSVIDGDVIMPLVPAAQARLHHGLSDHVEVGLSGGTDGLTVLTKLALVRSPSAASGWNVALEPSIGAGPSAGNVVGSARLPLLIGYRFGGHEITVGPRVHWTQTLAATWPPSGLLAGGTLGARIRAGAHFVISPEIGWLQPLFAKDLWPIPIANLGFSWE